MLLTGLPGVGKTTMTDRIHEHFKARGVKTAGITTREVRQDNERLGFRITDLSSGEEGWLARRDEGPGPRIGKYTVASEDLEKIAATALEGAALAKAGLIIIDEIGPMEMTNSRFRNAVSTILVGDKPVIATLKYGSHYPEVERVRETSVRLEITRDNRDTLFQKIIAQLDAWIEYRWSC